MELIRDFKKLGKNDAAIAGGKGASLGEMTQADIPVPPGFVILSESFEKFLEETDLNVEIDSILHSVNHKEMHTIENASEKIQALILQADMPKDIATEIQKLFRELDTKYVAVRSSATAEDSASAAWAGQLDSFLNTTQETLLENVKKCWASLFTPRAIFYRFEKELHKQKISVAVVVQKMIQSEVSGIAFSVHPVTQDYNQLIIEAGLGLGEAIVSGQITPDSYVVEKEPRKILDKNISEQKRGLFKAEKGGNEWRDISQEEGGKQTMTDKQILELSEIILHIEKHYGFPCDIEWAFEKGKFYVVQSRPITTLTREASQEKIIKLRHAVTRRYGLLSADFFIQGSSNPANYKKLFLTDVFVGFGVVSDRWAYGPQMKELGEILWKKEEKEAYFIDKVFTNVYRFGEKLLKDSIILKNKDFSDIADGELIKLFEIFAKKYKVFSVALAGLGMQFSVERQLRNLLKDKANIDEVLAILTFPVKQNIMGGEQKSLLEIGSLVQSKNIRIEAFGDLPKNISNKILEHIERFGWITRGGIDDPWTPEEVLKRLQEFIKIDCGEKLKALPKHEKENLKKSKDLLREIGADKKMKRLVDIAKELVYFRTYRTDYLNLMMFNLRPLLAEIGNRIGGYSFKEIYYFREEEIIQWQKMDKEELVKRMQNFCIFTVKPNEIIFSSDPEKFAELEAKYLEPEKLDSSAEIKGNTAFSGKITGRSVIVFSKKDLSKVRSGDVIISRMTTPDYVPAMEMASAFVTDEGGITCHAAIIAREMKKPCIIGTKIATQVLKDGDMVEVDADNGVVKILNVKTSEKQKSNDFLNIYGTDWFLAVTRNMSFWHQVCSNDGFFNHSEDFGVNVALEAVSIVENGTRTHIFYRQPNYGEYGQAVLNVIDTKKKVLELEKKYKLFAKELFQSLDACKKNLTVVNWKKFILAYTRMSAGLMLTATLGRSGGDLLIKKLQEKGYGDQEIPNIIAIITYPEGHTPLFNSQFDLLTIGVKVQNGKLSESKKEALFLDWLKSYQNIPVNFCDEPWTMVDAKSQLTNLLKKDCKKEVALFEADHKRRVKQAKSFIKEINNKDIEVLAYGIAKGTLLNEFRKNVFSKTSLEYRPIFQKIAEMGGSQNWRDCFYLTPDEMTTILQGQNFPIAKVVKEREIAGVCILKDSKDTMLKTSDTEKLYTYIKSLHSAAPSQGQDKTVKGHSANRGKVKGIVKIILSSKDFHKLNPGEILVTTMTSVDFVPVMERAAAFVTNEGGITSHAYIVAREMNKPCIIGTRNATQVLKDGDMVEVDADNGVVKIIK